MAAIAVRSPRDGAPAPLEGVPRRADRSPVALGAALGAAVLYAMFAEGAIGIPQESALQVGVAAIALATLAGLLFGRGLRVRPAPLALAGLALLAGFAVWSGLSIAWSIAPDESWLELNRALAYALVAALALVLGSSLPRAAERVALGYLAIATVVALYALGGKLFPWLRHPGDPRPRPRRPLLAPARAAGLLERARPGLRHGRADRAAGHRVPHRPRPDGRAAEPGGGAHHLGAHLLARGAAGGGGDGGTARGHGAGQAATARGERHRAAGSGARGPVCAGP